MRAFSALFTVLYLVSQPALAGFEWLPPAQTAPATVSAANVTDSPTYAPPPVTAEPLSIAPPPQAEMRNLSTSSKGGLYIDPYPLRNQTNADNKYTHVDDIALVEQGGGLTPAQLGAGMTTGYKAYNDRPPVQKPVSALPVIAKKTSSASGMTPLPGGDPAPLYDIEETYQTPVSQFQDPQQYAEAVGFGRDLPLALALSQIIPAGYTHSFGADVDAGATVSWQGGEPWNIVLNNMLRPLNMVGVIRGKQVSIQPLARL